MGGLFSRDEFAGGFMAEVCALEGRIGMANFALILARVEAMLKGSQTVG